VTEPPLARSVPGKGRLYEHPVTHELMPSVTNVIDVMNKPALPSWAAREVAGAAWDQRAALLAIDDREAAVDLLKGAPWRKRKKAADVGSIVHAVAEALALNEKLPSFSEEEEPYLDGFMAFVADFDPTFLVAEGTVFSETHEYAGTFDFLAVVGGADVLADTKTGKDIYREVALQLAALRNAEELWVKDSGRLKKMPDVDACIALHLKEGDYAVHVIEADDAAFEAFLGLRQAWGWAKSKGGVGPVVNPARFAASLEQPRLLAVDSPDARIEDSKVVTE
jgi:hypothetical protein